jgi:autotransporter translocation and assembly factor TamB
MRTAIRYLRRAISIVLLIVFFCVFAVVVLTRTPLFNEFLRSKVIAFVDANYRGALKIRRIEGSMWGSLRLEQVALLYDGKTIASISQLSLDYSLVPLLWRTVHLRITADSPLIDAQREPNGKWNLLEALSERIPTAPSSAKRALTIDVDSVRANHGTLQIVPNGRGSKYQVTNLDLDTAVRLPSSGMAVNLRRLTANIAGPNLPLLYAAVSLDYDAVASPAMVRLTDLELRTQQSTISATGDARLARTPSVDLKLLLRRLAAADVARLYPASQLKADLAGTITLQGPENSLHAIIALNAAGATLDGTADADITQKSPNYALKLRLSNADLQRIVRTSSAAGVLGATVYSNGTASDIGAATADVHLLGRNLKVKQYKLGTLDLTAQAANKNARLWLTLAAPAGHLTARATSTITANPAYHFELAAQHLNVAAAGVAANIRQTNLNLNAVIDGRGLTPAAADTGIKLKIDRSQVGQVMVEPGFLDARLANNRVDIARLHLNAADSTFDVHGSAGLAPRASSNISYTARSHDIRQLLALAGMKGSGSLDINGTVVGPRSGLRSRGTIWLNSIQTAGYSLEQGTTRYDLALTGSGAPYGKLNVTLNGVKAGTRLRTVELVLDAAPGVPHALALRLNVIDNVGRKDLAATHLIYQLPSIAGQLTQMSLSLPTGNWHLLAPADYKKDPRGLSITRLQLQSGSRELVLQGTIAQTGAQDFNLVLNRFDLAALQPLTPHARDLHGILSTKLWIAGTAGAPTISLAAQVSRLAMGEQPLGNLNTTVNYSGKRASFETVLQQDPTDHLTATGSLPMSLSWNHGVKTKIGNGIDVTVNSPRLNLAQLGSLFPDDVRRFQGALAINLRVQGTLKQPQPTGSIRITGVQGEIVPLGVTISSAELIVDLDPHAVRIQTIEARAGRGTISGNGMIGLQQYTPNALGVNLTFNQWPAINTEQYAATIGGRIAADGTLSRPRVHGQLEVLNGTIQPDIGFLSATSSLSPDKTIEVIEPGQPVSEPINNIAGPGARSLASPAATPEPSTFNNMAMKIAVIIHRNTWIRHPDAQAELEGNLDIDKDPGGPIRVSGEVRTVRGWMNYSNRQFTLQTGVFTFTGGRKIDPQLDIDAQYLITNYTIDILVGGTASKPTLQLKSQPELDQADILSLILFGKTTDALGQSQQASLQQEAIKMATGVAAQEVGQAVASSMGLQNMGITLNQVGSSGPAVGIGHYLGENTYVSASQPIGGSGGQTVSVQYFLLRWLSITTSTAADGSHEIDLNLVKEY